MPKLALLQMLCVCEKLDYLEVWDFKILIQSRSIDSGWIKSKTSSGPWTNAALKVNYVSHCRLFSRLSVRPRNQWSLDSLDWVPLVLTFWASVKSVDANIDEFMLIVKISNILAMTNLVCFDIFHRYIDIYR